MNGLVIDNFAGGGGASTGIELAGLNVDLAVNHWAEAMATHEANHPRTVHLTEDVFRVSPMKACRELWRRRGLVGEPVVDLCWFSPDCTHFSRAKGGKPVSKKIRGLAWVAVRWAKEAKPNVIILENVPEFLTWGPLGQDGKPDPARRGLTFRRWKGNLRGLGYKVEHRVLVAADYGAPTTRQRLFVIARRDGEPIVWPEPSHVNPREIEGQGDMFRTTRQPWRTAAECIDWSLPCPSIFERKRPLKPATLARIAAGIKRYVIDAADPFIVTLTHAGADRVQGLDAPLPTVTGANRGEMALCVPTLVGAGGRAGQSPPCGADEPMRTVTAKGDRALVEAKLAPFQVAIDNKSSGPGSTWPTSEPLRTITLENRHALVTAFLNKHYGGVVGHGLERPVGTVTGIDHHSLTTAHLMKFYGTSTGADLRDPMPTATGQGGHLAEVRAFLVAYYGNEEGGRSLRAPMGTVTGHDRMGLVMVRGEAYQIVDIGLRMLQPRELARAQGFPDDYELPANKSLAVALIGNSVPPPVAKALAAANVPRRAVEVAA